MTLEQLRAEREKKLARMRALVEAATKADRDMTEAEIAEYDQCKARVETVSREIEVAEAMASMDEPRPTVAQRQSADVSRIFPRGPEARREFASIGEFMAAVRFNQNDQRLSSLYHEFEPRAEMEMATGTAGGFAVPTQFLPQLMQVPPQAAAFRPRATVLPAGEPPDAAISFPALDQDNGADNIAKTYGGVSVSWLAEGGAKPETDAELKEITLAPQEVAGYITVTDKLLRNWRSSSVIIEGLLRGAVIAAEEHAFTSGDGVGKPHGVINSAAAYLVNRGASNTFTYPDLESMEARLLRRGGDPVWLTSQSVLPQLTSMRNYSADSPSLGDGALVWQPNARDANGMQTLMGKPIIWHERSPTLGTKGDVVLADLSYYTIKDGAGPFVAASEHVHFTSNKTVIKVFWNVDGRPWLNGNLTLENGWTVSPFVVLDVPA